MDIETLSSRPVGDWLGGSVEKGETMKAGIAIDDWKLPIFDRHLSQAGYAYEKHPGLTADTLTLIVVTDDAKALEVVVRAANTEAATRKGNDNGRNHTH